MLDPHAYQRKIPAYGRDPSFKIMKKLNVTYEVVKMVGSPSGDGPDGLKAR